MVSAARRPQRQDLSQTLPTLGEKVDKTIGRSSEITNTELTRGRGYVEQDPTGSGETHAFILNVLAEPFSTVSRKERFCWRTTCTYLLLVQRLFKYSARLFCGTRRVISGVSRLISGTFGLVSSNLRS